jgi:hypothetical protein
VRQGFTEHFQNPNPKLARVGNHGHVEPKDLYHEKVKILDRLKEHIWKENIVEMGAQTVANVVLIFVAPIPSLSHQNNIRITYAGTSNLIMEPVRSVPLYYVVMPQSIITVIETPFVSRPVHTIDGVKSKPQTLRGTKFVSLHEYIPREVNRVFGSQPLDPRGSDSNPP